ncbi:MAG: tyrosine-protein phosphatase [Bdellovibrionales bacterium]|nr:tyrosine-protein phosphatase [Bdellovibrionales bacterium]
MSSTRSATLRGAVAFSFLCTIPLLYALLLIPVATHYVYNRVVHQNFYEVVPGRLYRSASMQPERLAQVIKDFKIKTVVDLRLGGPGDLKYGVSEKQVVESSGAAYVHAKFRSSALPTQQRLDRLFRVLDTAQSPILFHCADGVHRTGFATVLWLVEKENLSFSQAMEQISLWYGYFEPEQLFKKLVSGEPNLLSPLFWYEDKHATDGPGLRAWLEGEIYPTLRSDLSS